MVTSRYQPEMSLFTISSETKAVVTGGASGIGLEIARELARRGALVLIADIDLARAEIAAQEIGPQATAWGCDVANHDEVVALAELASTVLGRVDLVFANAGVSVGGPLLDAAPAALDWILGVNVKGTWNVASVFGKQMRERGQAGRLCLTGSEHSLGMQHTGIGFYAATKMAVLGLADVLRAELEGGLIGVSVLCPGLVDTELYLSKRTGPLPQDPPPLLAFAQAVMRRGMPASEVAQAAIRGVERGDFLIVTHAASYPPAERRAREIADAFATQAPPTPDSNRYAVSGVIAAVGQDFARARARA